MTLRIGDNGDGRGRVNEPKSDVSSDTLERDETESGTLSRRSPCLVAEAGFYTRVRPAAIHRDSLRQGVVTNTAENRPCTRTIADA